MIFKEIKLNTIESKGTIRESDNRGLVRAKGLVINYERISMIKEKETDFKLSSLLNNLLILEKLGGSPMDLKSLVVNELKSELMKNETAAKLINVAEKGKEIKSNVEKAEMVIRRKRF